MARRQSRNDSKENEEKSRKLTPAQRKKIRQRAGRKAHRKGGQGERDVCKMLDSLFYPDSDSYQEGNYLLGGHFVRTPQSGAWGGEPILCGDVVPLRNGHIDKNWKFFVEVKRIRRSALTPFAWLAGDPGILRKWMDYAADRCKTDDLIPIVLWKTDFADWMVLFRMKDLESINEVATSLPFRSSVSLAFFELSSVNEGFICLPFDQWERWIR